MIPMTEETATDPRALIRREIHATAADLRALKRHWRTPPARRPDTPPPTAFDLFRSKRRATLLCLLMAHSRGRQHLRVWLPRHPDRRELPDRAAVAALVEEELRRMDAMRIGTPLFDEVLRVAARAILAR